MFFHGKTERNRAEPIRIMGARDVYTEKIVCELPMQISQLR